MTEEVPQLAEALDALLDADASMLRAVGHLRRLLASGEAERTTGVGLEQWVAIVTRHTQMDRRTLLSAARSLERFPALGHAVDERTISWPQLRKLAMTLRRAPAELIAALDGFLATAIDELQGVEPDVLVRQVDAALREWTGALRPTDEPPPSPYLALQPRLDGTGGSFSGELDAVGLAVLDEATAPTRPQLDAAGGVGAARADNLVARLLDPPLLDATDVPASSGVDGAPGCPGAAGVTSTAGDADVPEGAGRGHGLPPVKLLVRVSLDALLERTRTPADLLTRLTGGVLRLTSEAARRLVIERGADVRTVVLDDVGTVVGVGRASRIPPGWLQDATLAVHDTCSAPCCDRAARTSDLDHAVPWHPTGPDDLPGTTDVGNIAPLCGTTNREKEAAGWRAAQTADGRRVWHHPRSGLAVDTVPATWRPTSFRPATARRTGQGPRPPGPGGIDPPDPGGTDPPSASDAGPRSPGGADPPRSPGAAGPPRSPGVAGPPRSPQEPTLPF